MPQTTTLVEVLEHAESLAIVCHDNPDPDCLASALALQEIAESVAINEIDILYGGSITHQQNQAMVNLLDISVKRRSGSRGREYDLVGFVDHSRPGQNNGVPPDTTVDIVIDHHPVDNIAATYVDSRQDIGATATILTEYIRELDISIDERLATALLFGIRRETLGFMRETTQHEYAAAHFLHKYADTDLLQRLSATMFSSNTLDATGRAINQRTVRGACLVSTVGQVSERDAIPQAADYLLDLEGIETAIVFGIVDESIQFSARTRDSSLHIGRMLEHSFNEEGSAGGHQHMAGGRIPLGVFADLSEDEGLVELTDEIVTERLFEAVQNNH